MADAGAEAGAEAPMADGDGDGLMGDADPNAGNPYFLFFFITLKVRVE